MNAEIKGITYFNCASKDLLYFKCVPSTCGSDIIFTDPDFIACKLRGMYEYKTGYFMSFHRFFIHQNWYAQHRQCIKNIDFESNRVCLNNSITCLIDVVQIGQKRMIFKRQYILNDGYLPLGYVYTGVTFMDIENRTPHLLPDYVLNFKPLIRKADKSPDEIYVQIKNTAQDATQKIFKESVKKENIDAYKHANYAFYLGMFISKIKNLYFDGKPRFKENLKEISIVYKNEMVLGDQFEGSVWEDNEMGNTYCCTMMCRKKLCAYIEGQFHEQSASSKL